MLLKENKPMYGYITDEYWCDIGDLMAYSKAHMDVLDGKVKINIPGNKIKDRVWVGEGTVIEENVVIEEPCVIGANTRSRKILLSAVIPFWETIILLVRGVV